MGHFIRFAVLAAAVLVATSALAQQAPQGDQPIKQISLTADQVEKFLVAAPQIDNVDAAANDKAKLDELAKKHGYKNFDDYADIAVNIAFIMGGIDPKTKKFVEPSVAIKQEMEAAKADKDLPADEKAKILAELEAELKRTEPVKFPGNVELVKKYYDKLQDALK